VQLDVRGEMCPYPAMQAREALASLTGDNLIVLTDHPPALSTVPWEGAKLGFDSDIVEAGPGEWKIVLTRHDGAFDAHSTLERLGQRLRELGQG
jgi:tRNA 2-thiouridine synthesizing protein A